MFHHKFHKSKSLGKVVILEENTFKKLFFFYDHSIMSQ